MLNYDSIFQNRSYQTEIESVETRSGGEEESINLMKPKILRALPTVTLMWLKNILYIFIIFCRLINSKYIINITIV